MNDIYSRTIFKKLEKWLDRKEIFAIVGPRQAGKTTLMKITKESLLKKGVLQKNIVSLDCDDFDEAEPFIKDPKAFVKSFAQNENEKYYFFMDEFQYVPDGGEKLKVLYDSFPNIKFVVSGSSSLELKSKTAKYLVGRVFYFRLSTFSFGEFLNARDKRLARIYEEKNKEISDFILKNKNFEAKEDIFLKQISNHFEEYLLFGGYPEVIKAADLETKKIILKNIYDTYLLKDITELLKITDTITFRTVVSLVAASQANLLNFESIASDARSYYREVKWFLSVLEETFILNLIPPFHKNLSTELKKNPKAYFLDSGMRNYVVKNFNPPTLREDRGKLAEGAAFTGLLNMLQDEAEIKYWRTLAKAEVDFVAITGQEAIPIEVKFESFKKPKIGKSLRSFLTAYNPNRAIVVTKDYLNSIKVDNTIVKFVPICYI